MQIHRVVVDKTYGERGVCDVQEYVSIDEDLLAVSNEKMTAYNLVSFSDVFYSSCPCRPVPIIMR